MMFTHTKETDARIRRAYACGEKISRVADALGTTRNVIIGRAHRLGLSRPGPDRNYPKDRKMSDEVRKMFSDNLRELWQREDFAKASSQAASESLKRAHRDPVRHAKMMAGLKGYNAARKVAAE